MTIVYSCGPIVITKSPDGKRYRFHLNGIPSIWADRKGIIEMVEAICEAENIEIIKSEEE